MAICFMSTHKHKRLSLLYDNYLREFDKNFDFSSFHKKKKDKLQKIIKSTVELDSVLRMTIFKIDK